MVLLIHGDLVKKRPENLVAFWTDFPQLKVSSKKFLHQAKKTVEPGGLLYVLQREMAITDAKDKVIKVLGTEDATTCHMAVLRHTGTTATCLCHLDGCNTKQAIHDMIEKVEKFSQTEEGGRLELTLIGGFTDSRRMSEKLSMEILDAVHDTVKEVHLTTACVSDLNTEVKNGVPWPIVYGIGVNVATGEIFMGTFPDKGPDIPLRSARHFTGSHEVLDIYDANTNQLVIGPFYYSSFHNIDKLCQAPPQFIRQNLSTSPDQEPENFAESVRQTLIHMRDFPNPRTTVFKDNKPRLYEKNSDGSWIRVENT